MEIVLQLLVLSLGFFMLIKGADWFVGGASGIAEKFGIPSLVIGLTIVAMGTSAPEAAVSITAALKGSADITVGNIVGSNIINILVILGISAIIAPLAVAKSTVKLEMPFLIIVTALFLLLGIDGKIGFLDGVIFICAFALYLTYLFVMAKKNRTDDIKNNQKISLSKSVIWTIVGLVMIILGSDFTVDAASKIAAAFGMSERFIGLTIVALGTSLPELFTSVCAARRGEADIAIGNIVGSNIFNILFVVGISALIVPVPFANGFIFDTTVAIAAAILLLVCCIKDRQLKRFSGILMIAAYIGYFAVII
jgi:cation:H+ antiporter